MAQPFLRIVAIALLSVMVAAGAGAASILSASVVPTHAAGCHSRTPLQPQPADYRCCAGRHASVLTTNVFSPRPAVQAVDDTLDLVFVANESKLFPTFVAPSGGPPGILILRI